MPLAWPIGPGLGVEAPFSGLRPESPGLARPFRRPRRRRRALCILYYDTESWVLRPLARRERCRPIFLRFRCIFSPQNNKDKRLIHNRLKKPIFWPEKSLEEPLHRIMFRPPFDSWADGEKPGGETNQGRKQLFLGQDLF